MVASTPSHQEKACAHHCSSHACSPKASDTRSTISVDNAANFITCQLHFAEPNLTAGTATPDSTSQGTTAELQSLISDTVSHATSYCKQLQHEPGSIRNKTSESEAPQTTWPTTADAVTTAQQNTADTHTHTQGQRAKHHNNMM